MQLVDCYDRLKQVKLDYLLSLSLISSYLKMGENNPKFLQKHGCTLNDLKQLAERLPNLYFLKLFASFESSLRNFWANGANKSTSPPMQVLINAIAVRRGATQDNIDIVQEIREFRNVLIHEQHNTKTSFTFEDAIKHLNIYLSRFPIKW